MNLVRPLRTLLSALLLGSASALHAVDESGSRAPASSDVNHYISADRTPRYDHIQVDPYASFDTSLVRQISLTSKGIVFVRDDLTPGKTVDAFNAGSL
jgi:hypothetical protein